MKRISDIIVPSFLKRLDAYLLQAYPTIWETRIHFVLFYGVIAFIVLFSAGMLHPVSIIHLTIEPVAPINIIKEIYFSISVLFALMASVFWGLSQRTFSYRMASFCSLAFRMLLYGLGLFIIFGLDTTAYHLGVIFRTGYADGVMSYENYEKVKILKDYRYGFIMPEQDTFETNAAYFEYGETLMGRLCSSEDSLLAHRYDETYLKNKIKGLIGFGLIDSTQFRTQSILSNQAVLSELSYLLYLSNRLNSPVLSQQTYLSNRSYLSYRWFRSYESYLSYSSEIELFLSKIELYNKRFQKKANESESFKDLGLYKTLIDTIIFTKDKYSTIPKYPYLLEAGVRSKENAQLFLKEGIIFRFLKSLMLHLPLMVSIFFSTILMSYEKTLGGLLIYLLTIFAIFSILGEVPNGVSTVNLDDYIFIQPQIGFLILLSSFLQQKQTNTAIWAFHFVITGVFMCLVFALFGKEELLNKVGQPRDFAFFGVSVIGLVAAFMSAYLSRFPKEQ